MLMAYIVAAACMTQFHFLASLMCIVVVEFSVDLNKKKRKIEKISNLVYPLRLLLVVPKREALRSFRNLLLRNFPLVLLKMEFQKKTCNDSRLYKSQWLKCADNILKKII